MTDAKKKKRKMISLQLFHITAKSVVNVANGYISLVCVKLIT